MTLPMHNRKCVTAVTWGLEHRTAESNGFPRLQLKLHYQLLFVTIHLPRTRRARTHTGRMTASQTVVFTLPRCAVTCGINGTLQPALAVSELCSQWLWKGTEHKVDRKRGVLTALHGLLGCSEEVLQSGLYRSAFLLLLPCLPPGSSAPVCGCVCLFWVALLDQKKSPRDFRTAMSSGKHTYVYICMWSC